jgi:Cu/Ag efflux pump CusA
MLLKEDGADGLLSPLGVTVGPEKACWVVRDRLGRQSKRVFTKGFTSKHYKNVLLVIVKIRDLLVLLAVTILMWLLFEDNLQRLYRVQEQN